MASTSSSKKAKKPTPRGRTRTRGAATTRRAAGAAHADHDESVTTAEEMWALVYDLKEDRWDKTKGFRKQRVPKPVLDEANDPLDASRVILKVKYTGFCGSDAGIWFRSSFKNMIHSSLKAERKTTRVIGHEVLGVVEEAGSVAAAKFGYEKGELCAAESHLVCGQCHQ